MSDLVFIDEGNLDETDGKINFEKRELVYSTVQALQLYQSSRAYINTSYRTTQTHRGVMG